MDVIEAYLNLYITGFEVGVIMVGLPVMTGSAIGFLYKIASRG